MGMGKEGGGRTLGEGVGDLGAGEECCVSLLLGADTYVWGGIGELDAPERC